MHLTIRILSRNLFYSSSLFFISLLLSFAACSAEHTTQQCVFPSENLHFGLSSSHSCLFTSTTNNPSEEINKLLQVIQCTNPDSTQEPISKCPRSAQDLCPFLGEKKESKILLAHGFGQGCSFLLANKDSIPYVTGDEAVDQKLAYGMILMNTGNNDQAIEHFTKIIEEQPSVVGAYLGRGTAFARKGIHIKEYADKCLQDFTKSIKLEPNNPEPWARRAEVYFHLGHTAEALSDYNTAIDIQPTAHLLMMSGTILFLSENYESAYERIKKSIDLDSNQPGAYLYLGLSLFHTGKVKESIEVFEKALDLKPNFGEAHRSLGHAYRELGQSDKAIDAMKAALVIEPNSAQTYQLRGSLYYMSGNPYDAMKDFKACVNLEPYSPVCQYMRSLCHAAVGEFYDAVKSSTKLIVHADINSNVEVSKARYLREYSRYLHAHLDTPISSYSPDVDVDGRFRDHWAKNLPFHFQNYTEQPGIQPHISDVHTPSFQEFSQEAKLLICKSATLGPLLQYQAPGFIPNTRHYHAMGLAVLEVAQVVHQFWKSPKSVKGFMGRKFSWKDVFDIAVKWRRLVDPGQAVLWLDMMPEKSIKAGFNNHMNLLRGQVKSVRYSVYFDRVFNLAKRMLMSSYRMAPEFYTEVEKVMNCRDLLRVVKKQSSEVQPGLLLVTHIPSLRGNGKLLDGIMITLSEDGRNNIIFSLDTATTETRTASYHNELEFIWNQLNDQIRKGNGKNTDTVINLILSLAFYFFNLLPLSRGSSAVAYAVALGVFLAADKEVTTPIPEGKEIDMEALLAETSDVFQRQMKSWLGFKRVSKPVSSLPLVSEVFPTLRTAIEALNAQIQCSDQNQIP